MKYTEAQRLAASKWFFDIHDAEDEDLSSEFLQEWLQWLDADEAHRYAFEAVESAYQQITVPESTTPEPRSAPYDGSISVAAWREQAAQSPSSWRRRAAIAASVGLVLIGGAAWRYKPSSSLWRPSSGEFTTRTGEHLALTLADGSHVDLGARSRLEVTLSPQSRDIRLLGGEAYFKVQRDPARPFRVHVLDGIVTAIGTAFNVRATEDRVTVAVSEGVVSVGEAVLEAHSVRLGQGEQLTFSERPPAPESARAMLSRVDPAQSGRWREGWLVYRDEPLRYVIADVERYTVREIAVADSVPAQLRFTGAVSKDAVAEWVEALPAVFPVQVERHGTRLQVSARSGVGRDAAP